MKRTFILGSLIAIAIATPAFAGGTGKQVTPPAPAAPSIYGTGWYSGLQLGISAYQDFGGSRDLNRPIGLITLQGREKIGFAGGFKFGYVFGTGKVRPAIEADLFYAGVQGDMDVRLNGAPAPVNADADLNSGAFLVNFIARFGTGKFQPYIGAGAGGYYAEASDINIVTPGFVLQENGGGGNTGFAWQLIAGADYYFTERTSGFVEYKFLNYEDPDVIYTEDRISQHIVVLGIRYHF
jgi:opacity protein-like surface antigen